MFGWKISGATILAPRDVMPPSHQKVGFVVAPFGSTVISRSISSKILPEINGHSRLVWAHSGILCCIFEQNFGTNQGFSGTFWRKFLIDAGIPVRAAESYTSSFVDNRITELMVPDLNKVRNFKKAWKLIHRVLYYISTLLY